MTQATIKFERLELPAELLGCIIDGAVTVEFNDITQGFEVRSVKVDRMKFSRKAEYVMGGHMQRIAEVCALAMFETNETWRKIVRQGRPFSPKEGE